MKKAIFLDRDGTINKDIGYLHRIEDFIYLDGAIEGMKKLYNAGYLLVIITNQSGIARGFYTEDDYEKLTCWFKRDLEDKGIKLAACYHCPHYLNGSVPKYSFNCSCRKPGTALFNRAIQELSIQEKGSYSVGDRLRDLSICLNTKINGILLAEHKALPPHLPEYITISSDLLHAAEYIISCDMAKNY